MTGDPEIPISQGTGWLREELQLERGEQPHHHEIARKLRDPGKYPIPQVVREHIADLLDLKTPKRRGNPPPSQPEHRSKLVLAYFLRKRHGELMDQLEQEGEDNGDQRDGPSVCPRDAVPGL